MSRSSATRPSWTWNFGYVSGCVLAASGWHMSHETAMVLPSSSPLWKTFEPATTQRSASRVFQVSTSRCGDLAVGRALPAADQRRCCRRRVAIVCVRRAPRPSQSTLGFFALPLRHQRVGDLLALLRASCGASAATVDLGLVVAELAPRWSRSAPARRWPASPRAEHAGAERRRRRRRVRRDASSASSSPLRSSPGSALGGGRFLPPDVDVGAAHLHRVAVPQVVDLVDQAVRVHARPRRRRSRRSG